MSHIYVTRRTTAKGERRYVVRCRWRGPLVGHIETSELTLADVQEAVAKLSDELEPRTVGRYLSSLGMALDFSGLDRNPVRDPAERAPTREGGV